MTKSEFVDQVASESGLGKGEANKAVEAALQVIEDTLKRGGEINITGFGKFSVAERGARQGHSDFVEPGHVRTCANAGPRRVADLRPRVNVLRGTA